MHRQLIAVLGDATQLTDVGQIELRVDTLAKEVHGQVDHVDVAGSFAVAEQRPFDSVGPGHHSEFRGGDAGAAVVVRVQAQNDLVPASDVAVHPLDHVAVDVGGAHLDGRRQVDDHRALRSGIEGVDDRVADSLSELELGTGEGLGAVLVVDRGVDGRFEFATQARSFERDIDDPVLIESEHDLALQRRRRVIDVDDRLFRSGDRLEGATDQTFPALGEDLNRDVVWDLALLDDLADEIEIGL